MDDVKSFLLYGSLCLALSTISTAQVYTNQTFIESLSDYSTMDDTDMDAVLKVVLDNISESITVYPTEGYYYFWFYHQGNLIRGNLRFSYDLVDKGQVSFAYYYDIEGKGGSESQVNHKIYSHKDGLILTEISSQKYQLNYQGVRKTVILNIPVSDYQTTDKEAMLGDMQDESGVVFTFIFNHQTKQFYYLLDGSRDYEYYYDLSSHISVGARTGFVYFNDNSRVQPRKILVGVAQKNSYLNNFYDGPFDQLPDHNLGHTKFKEYIAQAYPYFKGKVDNYGNFLDSNSSRVAVDNYVQYEDLKVFKYLEQCHSQSINCVQNFITLSKPSD